MADETPKKKSSWKTSAAGIIGGVMLILGEVLDILGVQVENLTDGKFSFAMLAAGLGAIGIGWFARDNKVSSEDAGVK